MNVIAVVLVLCNLITYILMGVDKHLAIKGKSRISELTFALLSMVGGGVGLMFAMARFSHKTNKALFSVIIPIWTLILYAFVVVTFIKIQI